MKMAPDPIRVIIGASSQHYPGWITTQQNDLDIVRWHDWERLFRPGSIQTILAEHVWEHLDGEDAYLAAANCFAFLMDGGFVRCAVPDGLFPDAAYQRTVRIGGPGPKDHPAASHRSLFTWRTLTSVFVSVGFQVRLLEWWDDDGLFQRREWDANDGFIYRSLRFDHRNRCGRLGFTSLILDATKPVRGGQVLTGHDAAESTL